MRRTDVLWYKSWLDTRWPCLIGLLLMVGAAASMVFAYPRLMALVPLMPAIDARGELGREIREGVELARTYRGFIWSNWFRQTALNLGTLFAVLLGTGGVASLGFRGGELFTLSLPVSRRRLLAARAAAGLSEWLVLALASSLVIPLVSPAVGGTYLIADALAHALCLFIGGALFLCFALLLSTLFSDPWRPLLIALSIAVVAGVCERLLFASSGVGIFALMDGETYFRSGRLPALGLAAAASASALLLYLGTVAITRRDF